MANFSITTNIPAIVNALDTYGQEAVGAVYAGILRTSYEALNEARLKVPQGSTGELLRSIVLEENEAGLSVDIFTNKVYAAFVEFGYDDTQTVRAHKRTIAKAFGRRITPKTIQVKEHARKVVSPARPYMGLGATIAETNIEANVLAEIEALSL